MNRRAWLLVLPLIGAIFGYWRALRGEFVFDDQANVVLDPSARSFSTATRVLLPSLLGGGRGFTAWTFALNHAWGGLNPFGYHLVNLGSHLAVTILVFIFTRALLRRAAAASPDGCALAVAGAFALHPLHTQAVCYIAQRSEVMASGAYLGALMLLLLASTARRLGATLLLASALVVFAIGLGTKVIVVTMPVAYLLIVLVLPDRSPAASRPGWQRHLVLTAPFILLGAWKARNLLQSVKGHPDAGFSVDLPGVSVWTYFMTEWKVILVYVRLLFWPSGQRADWLYPVATSLDVVVAAAGVILFVGVVLAIVLVWQARRLEGTNAASARVVAFGIFWFLLVLAPTSSFVPLADLLFEHRTYLASVGLFVAVATLMERLTARLPARAGAVAVVFVWAALGVALYRRNAVWESSTALWRDVTAKHPTNVRAHTTLASIYQDQGDLSNAIREYGLALQWMAYDHIEIRLAAMQGMAAAMADAGRPGDAITVIRDALKLKSGDLGMLATLAATQLRAGDFDGAERSAQEVLSAQPGHSQALLTLGEIRLVQEDTAGAVHYLAEAIAIQPDEPVRLLEYGRALAQLGRRQEACQAWQTAARSPEARNDDRDGAAGLSAGLGCPVD